MENKLDEIKSELKELNTFERLCGGYCEISLDSYDWLIEQANKIDHYEKFLKSVSENKDNMENYIRAKQALKHKFE